MKEPQIIVAIISPDEPNRLERIDNTLEAMHAVVGGRIELFPVVRGDESIVGVCNDEFLFLGEPVSAFNFATGTPICGTFFVAGDRDGDEGREFCSLSPFQVEQVAWNFGRVEGRELIEAV